MPFSNEDAGTRQAKEGKIFGVLRDEQGAEGFDPVKTAEEGAEKGGSFLRQMELGVFWVDGS
jgi:hypothetical protein